jgi:hypothetical protein
MGCSYGFIPKLGLNLKVTGHGIKHHQVNYKLIKNEVPF